MRLYNLALPFTKPLYFKKTNKIFFKNNKMKNLFNSISVSLLVLLMMLASSCKNLPKVYYEKKDYLKAFVKAGKSKGSQVLLPNDIQFGMDYNEVEAATTKMLPRLVLPSSKELDVMPVSHGLINGKLVSLKLRIITAKRTSGELVDYLNSKYGGVSYFHSEGDTAIQSWFDGNIEIALSSSMESQGFLIEYINVNSFVE